jgi:glucosamine-phosphate N-acetyltransferase
MHNIEYDTLLHFYQNNKEIIEEIKNQYLFLLSFLTHTPTITTEEFIYQINEISKIGVIIICYSKNVETQTIVVLGSGTILYEPKIIHGCKKVGHIEDIVVHQNYRSYGIAKNILNQLTVLAKENNCYKIILDCKKELCGFYEKNGFTNNGIQMTNYL